jgi:hypothetical protein
VISAVYPGILPGEPQDSVDGLVIEGLSEREIVSGTSYRWRGGCFSDAPVGLWDQEIFNAFEEEYEKKEVDIRLTRDGATEAGGPEVVKALVYVW